MFSWQFFCQDCSSSRSKDAGFFPPKRMVPGLNRKKPAEPQTQSFPQAPARPKLQMRQKAGILRFPDLKKSLKPKKYLSQTEKPPCLTTLLTLTAKNQRSYLAMKPAEYVPEISP